MFSLDGFNEFIREIAELNGCSIEEAGDLAVAIGIGVQIKRTVPQDVTCTTCSLPSLRYVSPEVDEEGLAIIGVLIKQTGVAQHCVLPSFAALPIMERMGRW